MITIYVNMRLRIVGYYATDAAYKMAHDLLAYR